MKDVNEVLAAMRVVGGGTEGVSGDGAPGTYKNNLWWNIFIRAVKFLTPDNIDDIIDQAVELLPMDKLMAAITLALAEWKAGTSFIEILNKVLSQWLDIVPNPTPGPIRFTVSAKPEQP